jgi:hypothetical protein
VNDGVCGREPRDFHGRQALCNSNDARSRRIVSRISGLAVNIQNGREAACEKSAISVPIRKSQAICLQSVDVSRLAFIVRLEISSDFRTVVAEKVELRPDSIRQRQHRRRRR